MWCRCGDVDMWTGYVDMWGRQLNWLKVSKDAGAASAPVGEAEAETGTVWAGQPGR